jgi:hypothetical protein
MLLTMKGRKGLGVGCGDGGREYGRITEGGRRDWSRPAGSEVALHVDCLGYALVRTATGTAPAPLAVEVWELVGAAAALRIEGEWSAAPFVLGRLELHVRRGDAADEHVAVPLDVDQSRTGLGM